MNLEKTVSLVGALLISAQAAALDNPVVEDGQIDVLVHQHDIHNNPTTTQTRQVDGNRFQLAGGFCDAGPNRSLPQCN